MFGCVTIMPNVSTLAGLITVCVMLGLLEMVKIAQVNNNALINMSDSSLENNP